jgi:hypothetical protein
LPAVPPKDVTLTRFAVCPFFERIDKGICDVAEGLISKTPVPLNP